MATKNTGLFGSVIRAIIFATSFFPLPLPEESSVTIETALYDAPIGPEMRPISNITMGFFPAPPQLPIRRTAPFALVEWSFLVFFGVLLCSVAFFCFWTVASTPVSVATLLRKYVDTNMLALGLEFLEQAAKFLFPQHGSVLAAVFGSLRILVALAPAPPSRTPPAVNGSVSSPSVPSSPAASCRDAAAQTMAESLSLTESAFTVASFAPSDFTFPQPCCRDMAVQTATEPLSLSAPAVVFAVAPSPAASHPTASYRDAEAQTDSVAQANRKQKKHRDKEYALANPEQVMSQSFEGLTSEKKERLAKQQAWALEAMKARGG